ncbi:VOC family protein [Gluconacetobacter azotocaptans]|uniref:VOC family protein n=1 Tax=Gluconacetobacter azotocaptans TaxID=142834 RepID=A0A7W4JU87_9PROT|nr:VOC family protein [Gluconacetobacter azotocaptans]MBB2191027.1 VOC family protein [Gluconacetobacter azotocaptans]GBQ31397.1 glyoxalase [Gluconacetobacter azotocaptans DSM 13594]
MSAFHGQFVWYELATLDAPAASAFYRAVIGWNMKDAGLPDREYTILSAGERPIGGLMALSQADCTAGAQPGWIGYVAVDDVDAIAARIADAGGAILRPAGDIPGVGRFAIVGDPQGAVFALFGAGDRGAMPPAAPGTPGTVGWHELLARDRQSAFAFYADLFGWALGEAVDMGEMGIYQIFTIGGEPAGGMMTRAAAMPAPFWLYYVNVDGIDAAIGRVREAGGRVANGPHQVPDGSWIVQCLDPQDCMFALVAPTR